MVGEIGGDPAISGATADSGARDGSYAEDDSYAAANRWMPGPPRSTRGRTIVS